MQLGSNNFAEAYELFKKLTEMKPSDVLVSGAILRQLG
jgi:hypothetical protein